MNMPTKNSTTSPIETSLATILQCQKPPRKFQTTTRAGLGSDHVQAQTREQALAQAQEQRKRRRRQEWEKQSLGKKCSRQWRSPAENLRSRSMRTEGQPPDGLCSKLVAGCWAFSASVFTALTQDHSAVSRTKVSAHVCCHPPSPLDQDWWKEQGWRDKAPEKGTPPLLHTPPYG